MKKRLLSAALTLLLTVSLTVPAAADLKPPLYAQTGAGPEELTAYTALTAEEDQALTEEERFPTVDQMIRAAGGIPGQINVMVNGRCLNFPGAAPELVDGRTMVPLRAAMEDLGAAVTYDHAARTAAVALDGLTLTHVIGTRTITRSDGTAVEMDVPSYLNGGSTMVPLRFFSEALGYDVWWDADFRAAVLLDRAALTERIDGEFTVLNGLLAKQYGSLDLSRTCESALSFSGSARVFNTIDGDETYRLSGEASLLFNREAMELRGELDLSVLAALMEQMWAEAGETLPQAVLECLSPLTFEMIFAGERFYGSSPFLTALLREAGYSVPAGDLWLAADTGADFPALYHQLLAGYQGMTFGELLCGAVDLGGTASPFTLYQEFTNSVYALSLVYGDDTFTKAGTSYRWHFGEAEYLALQQTLLGFSTPLEESGVTEFSMDMTIRQDGRCDFDMAIAAADPYTGASAFTLTVSGASAPGSSHVDGRIQMRNVCDLTFETDSTLRPSADEPAAAPPAGAAVLEGSASAPSQQ